MLSYLPFMIVFALLLLAGVIVWRVRARREKREAERLTLERLGFRPCPEKKAWLDETIAHIENNQGFQYEVRDPQQLPGEPVVYHYAKFRHQERQESFAEAELLFPLKRASSAGLVLFVKPSTLTSGIASRVIAAVATGPWDSQPDDLQRLPLPPQLAKSNLLGALGPPNTSLYDLIDDRALGVVMGLGDAGAMEVKLRDEWCVVTSAAEQTPFRVGDIIARFRALL